MVGPGVVVTCLWGIFGQRDDRDFDSGRQGMALPRLGLSWPTWDGVPALVNDILEPDLYPLASAVL
jgi:hypothetical protein